MSIDVSRDPSVAAGIWVPIGKGFFTLVDVCDVRLVTKCKWRVRFGGTRLYAERQFSQNGKRKYMSVHRQVLGNPQFRVDHMNGNGLNNRRANIRAATPSQNGANRRKGRRKTHSRFKGVTWWKTRRRWIAQIVVNWRHRTIGRFKTELEAAMAYDAEAKKTWGVYALTNFP